MSYPASAVKNEYEDAARIGLRNACKDAEAKHDLPEGTLLAVASRETHMKNITGDGGHGRGVFQIDDRYHADWLRKHGAGGSGQVPPVRDAAFYAASILAANLRSAKSHGVPENDRMRFALAAYNAGPTGALAGYRAGAVDSRTTGDDYSADVFARRKTIATFLPMYLEGVKIGAVGVGVAVGPGGDRTIPGPVGDDKKGARAERRAARARSAAAPTRSS